MPPFTSNLRKNGNFFWKFPFLLSSCRHFVDSLTPRGTSPRGVFIRLRNPRRRPLRHRRRLRRQLPFQGRRKRAGRRGDLWSPDGGKRRRPKVDPAAETGERADVSPPCAAEQCTVPSARFHSLTFPALRVTIYLSGGIAAGSVDRYLKSLTRRIPTA